jgi:hypothetical protein
MNKLQELAYRYKTALLSLLNPWKTVRELREENDRLVETIANPALTGFRIANGTLDVDMSGVGPQILAGMFMAIFEKYPAHTNYIEATFASPEGPILVTVVSPKGKTPHQLRADAESRADVLRAALEEAESVLRSAGCDVTADACRLALTA